MEHIIPTFSFGGHEIDLVVKEIDPMVEYNLENVAGAPGTMKILVLRSAIKSLRIDGQNRPLYRRDEDNAQIFTLPNIRDRETRKSLSEEILRHAVEKNDFLGLDERFAGVFGRYLPEDDRADEDRENPTKDGGSSGATSSPGGGGETQE